ncbi:MAG: hypothetical protein SNJ70_05750 [Armatimonadota bacterium]
MYLILLETSGNQNFIFNSNRMKENVGASEIIYRSCIDWLEEEIEKLDSKHKDKIEIKLNTSGKAYLTAKDKDSAEAIIGAITLRCLKEAPTLDIAGAYVDLNEEHPYESVKEVHEKLAKNICNIPNSNSRFQRLPIIQSCNSSGLPAKEMIDIVKGESRPLSSASIAKRAFSEKKKERFKGDDILKEVAGSIGDSIEHFNNNNKGEDSKNDWMAIVHADGNGLGQIFLNFKKASEKKEGNYWEKLKRFSDALDDCTKQAFIEAIKVINTETKSVPLILGGDDLTVICPGNYAIDFTKEFLLKFKELTKDNNAINYVKDLENGVSACAGIALIKPHYPFSAAYSIAEDLIKSAKKVKEKSFGTSALDFHVVYDSSPTDLDSIRDELEVDNCKLYGGPYIVDEDGLEGWGESHKLSRLIDIAGKLNEKDDDGKNKIPSTLTHILREELFSGKENADAKYELMKPRCKYLKEAFNDSLFINDGDSDISLLIDANELSKLIQEKEKKENKEKSLEHA